MLAYLGEFASGFCFMFFFAGLSMPVKQRLIASSVVGLTVCGAFNAIF